MLIPGMIHPLSSADILPSIFEQVVSTSDLSSCMTVCRLWCNSAYHFLFREEQAYQVRSSPAAFSLCQGARRWGREGRVKHIVLSEAAGRDTSAVEALLEAFHPFLERLEYPVPTAFRHEKEDKRERFTINIVDLYLARKCLSLRYLLIRADDMPACNTLFSAAATQGNKLRSLRLFGHMNAPAEDAVDEIDIAQSLQCVRGLPQLEEVEILDCTIGDQVLALIPPQLETLVLAGAERITKTTLLQYLIRTTRHGRLRDLTLYSCKCGHPLWTQHILMVVGGISLERLALYDTVNVWSFNLPYSIPTDGPPFKLKTLELGWCTTDFCLIHLNAIANSTRFPYFRSLFVDLGPDAETLSAAGASNVHLSGNDVAALKAKCVSMGVQLWIASPDTSNAWVQSHYPVFKEESPTVMLGKEVEVFWSKDRYSLA